MTFLRVEPRRRRCSLLRGVPSPSHAASDPNVRPHRHHRAVRGGAGGRASADAAERRRRLPRLRAPGRRPGSDEPRVRRQDRAGRGRHRRRRVAGSRRLRRHPVLRRVRRDFPGSQPGGRDPQRPRGIADQPNLGRAARVRHQDQDRGVLRGRRRRRARRSVRPQLLRYPGTRRDVPRPGDSQDRARQVPDRRRRLHDLRPADAALGDGLGLGDDQPRRLRAAEEHGVPGQERPVVLHADLLLPDPGRRPRDRLPPADLRHLDAPRPVVQLPFLLGDQPQPGRDRHPRLVLQGGAADRRRISLHHRAGLDGHG